MLVFDKKRFLAYISLLVILGTALAGCSAGTGVLNSTTGTTTDDGESLAGTSTSTSTSTNSSANLSPQINLSSSQTLVGYGGEVILSAEALDPDGDKVTLRWSATGGTIVACQAQKATWKAPIQAGRCEIKCIAEDGKGGSNSGLVGVDVVGGRKYLLELDINRSSTILANNTEGPATEWLSLPGVKASIVGTGMTGISDSNGQIIFDLDAGGMAASAATVLLEYLDWEISFPAIFPASGTSRADRINFYPGYEGITVAVGKGDNFINTRGGLEVDAVECLTNGDAVPVREVTVGIGSDIDIAQNGTLCKSVVISGTQVEMSLQKSGYRSLTGLRIPVQVDGQTLVRVRMTQEGSTVNEKAKVSWTAPYNGQKAVPVIGPFVIGFAQGMEMETIFDDFQMTVKDTVSGETRVFTGPDVKKFFTISWEGNVTITLTPKEPLNALSRYSLLVSRWGARTVDGRYLQSYSGNYLTFTTDDDPTPIISMTSPKNGDTQVPRWGPFLIRFDRPMDTGSLYSDFLIEITDVKSGAALSLTGSSLPAAFSVEWQENDKLLNLVPRRSLKANNPYLLKIKKSGLRSKSGRKVANLENLWAQFTTGEL